MVTRTRATELLILTGPVARPILQQVGQQTPIDAEWERVVVDDQPPPEANSRFGRVVVTPL